MSQPEDLNLDLEKAFLPSWAQETAANRYANYQGEPESRRPRWDDRSGGRRGGGFGGGAPRGPRPGGPGPGGGGGGPRGERRDFRGPRGPRPGGPSSAGAPQAGLQWDPAAAPRGGRPDRPGRGGPRGPGRGGPFGRDRQERRPEPLIPVEVILTPEPAGAASLARQIRLSGRAYPLFEVAGLVVQKPDRYSLTLKVQKDKDGKVAQPLFACSLDDTVWLSEADAVRHILGKHFDTFYQTDKIPTEPPKGTYTFVAQCGISGEILGPPNYHGYQDKLRQLHAARFGRMPFETFKARVRIVKDEAVVKQWLEEQSFKFEYTTLNVPEAGKLDSRAAVEAHFRAVHLPNVVKEVDTHPVRAEQVGQLPGPLQTLIRVTLDKERRFPLRTATALSTAFAQAGLHFFKRDKTIVHVAVARPHFLDLTTQVVSDGVKRVIAHLEAHPKATRREVLETLAPLPATPAPEPAPAAEPAASPESATTTEPAAEAAPAPVAPAPAPTSPEREALLTDLHWLVHQGHVIEFANGLMELARRPQPKDSGGAEKAKSGNANNPAQNPKRKDKEPRTPKGPKVPWSRKTGLYLPASPALQPYGPTAPLAGL